MSAPPSPPPPSPPPSPAGSARADASTALSQTSILQMTSAAPAPAPAPPDGNKWSCEVCTYENFPLSRKCTMCLAPKPAACEDIYRLQHDGASALPPAPPSPPAPPAPPAAAPLGAEGVADRLKPLRISSPPGQASASSIVKWACPTCTYENWPKSQKCAMCGAAPTQEEGGASAGGGGGHKPRSNADLLWLQACLGVVEGCAARVEAYLACGGDPARALTAAEVALLDRASAFDAGHTLVHLAVRFRQEHILAKLLARLSKTNDQLKRSPSYVAPDLAAAIRRHMAGCVRLKKGSFPARYINEFCTFSLPAEIEELPAAIQEQLFCELLDREAQRTLEAEPVVNWSAELTEHLGSRLFALWNRSAGDCLPDAVAQAAYGVFDRHNALRRALADTLAHCPRAFYERWQAWERLDLPHPPRPEHARAEWARLTQHAAQPGTALHQLHVFALAHVMRRPIIVYGVNLITSFRGEALGYARFQGIYLPLLWEPEFCSKSPLCLGYTRGHFSALVPMEPYAQRHAYICPDRSEGGERGASAYLPLADADGKLLPVHFLMPDEMGSAEALVRRWTAAGATRGGVLAAKQHLHARPLLVAQMLEEWLNHYRRLAQQTRGPFPPRLAAPGELSSDPDTDDE